MKFVIGLVSVVGLLACCSARPTFDKIAEALLDWTVEPYPRPAYPPRPTHVAGGYQHGGYEHGYHEGYHYGGSGGVGAQGYYPPGPYHPAPPVSVGYPGATHGYGGYENAGYGHTQYEASYGGYGKQQAHHNYHPPAGYKGYGY